MIGIVIMKHLNCGPIYKFHYILNWLTLPHCFLLGNYVLFGYRVNAIFYKKKVININ